MFNIGLAISRLSFSKISTSLKLLQLTPPVTKMQIKTRYKELAKQLHPDMTIENGKKKSKEQISKDSQTFIQITKAYKYLNEIQEQQINRQKQDDEVRSQYVGRDEKEKYYRSMNEQQRKRHTTYSYFNKRYRKPSTQEQQQKKPLWKELPQLFFGFFLVFIFLMEWANAALKRTAKNNPQKSKLQTHSDVFRHISYKGTFQKPQNIQSFE